MHRKYDPQERTVQHKNKAAVDQQEVGFTYPLQQNQCGSLEKQSQSGSQGDEDLVLGIEYTLRRRNAQDI